MAFYTDFPKYPTAIFNNTNYPEQVDDTDIVYAKLINALKEEMQACFNELGVLPKGDFSDVTARLDAMLPHYNDRGDISSWDFEVGDLTTDNNWHDLDLSSIIPLGTKAVSLRLKLLDATPDLFFAIRKKGNTQERVSIEKHNPVADIWTEDIFILAPSTDRKLSYVCSNTTWDGIRIVIMGWWL